MVIVLAIFNQLVPSSFNKSNSFQQNLKQNIIHYKFENLHVYNELKTDRKRPELLCKPCVDITIQSVSVCAHICSYVWRLLFTGNSRRTVNVILILKYLIIYICSSKIQLSLKFLRIAFLRDEISISRYPQNTWCCQKSFVWFYGERFCS